MTGVERGTRRFRGTGKDEYGGIFYDVGIELGKQGGAPADFRKRPAFFFRAGDKPEVFGDVGVREDVANFTAKQAFAPNQCDDFGFSQVESPGSVWVSVPDGSGDSAEIAGSGRRYG